MKKIIESSGLKVDQAYLRSFTNSIGNRDVKSMFVLSGGSSGEAAGKDTKT